MRNFAMHAVAVVNAMASDVDMGRSRVAHVRWAVADVGWPVADVRRAMAKVRGAVSSEAQCD
jgi:uncharacterized protein YoxC